MKLEIIKFGDKRLGEKSLTVKLPLSDEDSKLANDLAAYLDYAALPTNTDRQGVGIAAVQVGILKRMFAVRIPFDENNIFKDVLVNPVIIYKNGRAALDGGEGCLSIPEDKKGLVHRNNEIKIKGFSVSQNKEITYELSGYNSIVFQHELDHLDGRLYFSRINPLEPNKPKTKEILI